MKAWLWLPFLASVVACGGTFSDASGHTSVGCGAPPFCDQGCTAPCGCCPCADGQPGPQGYVCSGGCYELVSDGGGPTCTYAGRT